MQYVFALSEESVTIPSSMLVSQDHDKKGNDGGSGSELLFTLGGGCQGCAQGPPFNPPPNVPSGPDGDKSAVAQDGGKKDGDHGGGKKKGDDGGGKKKGDDGGGKKGGDHDGGKKGGGNDDGKGPCLIATAAFGSELSPEVQFLRNFRDNRILATASGSSFMNVFNAWYYSFSPSVADYERGQPWLRAMIRTGIYPLLGILEVSEKSFSLMPSEYGSVVSGLTASSLIGLVYFTPFALCERRLRTYRKSDFKSFVVIIAIVTMALLVALLVNNKVSLMVTTSLFVITLCAISSILGARLITTLSNRLKTWIKIVSSRIT